MADPLSGVAAMLGAPSLAPARLDADDEVRARITRLSKRFLYAWAHPLWDRWRTEAKEDLEFVAGTGQWEKGVAQKLRREERTVLTINEVRPVVEVLSGYERGSRLEIRAVPEGPEDAEDVTILNHLMKRAMDDQDGLFTMSDGFKEGVTCGLAVFYLGVDYTEDPIHGKAILLKARPGEVLWDPDAQKYDLDDAREIFWQKMVPTDVLKAAFPEHAETIDDALEPLGATLDQGTGGALPMRDPRDGYSRFAEHLDGAGIPFYDPIRDEIRVLEVWYRDWQTVHLLVDGTRNTVEKIPEGDAVTLKAARKMAKLDPKVRVVTRQQKIWQMTTILPSLGIELEAGHPFENDLGAHPFAPFVAYREGDEILGIVRNLKDPQREVNKRRSAIADNVSRHGSIRWFATRASLENPEALESGQGAGYVYWVRNMQQVPKEIPPPPLPKWVWEMNAVAKNEIREISGVNADLLGQHEGDPSGIAMARRQQQGQVIATSLFDNYRRTRRIIGRRLAKRVQQIYTGEMTIRLDPGAAGSDFVTINQREVDTETGQETVRRNVPNLKYDVVISDAPATPTARAQALMLLMDFVSKMPALGPILADVMVGMAEIPDRELVVSRVRTWMQAQGMAVNTVPGPAGSEAMPTPPMLQAAPPGAPQGGQDVPHPQGMPQAPMKVAPMPAPSGPMNQAQTGPSSVRPNRPASVGAPPGLTAGGYGGGR